MLLERDSGGISRKRIPRPGGAIPGAGLEPGYEGKAGGAPYGEAFVARVSTSSVVRPSFPP